MENLQNEKVIISYFESVKKGSYFEDIAEVHVEELTAQEFEEVKKDNVLLFDRIIENCKRLAESVQGLARYEVTLFYKIYDKEEEDFIIEEEKNFIFYVKNGFVCDSEDIEEIKQEFKDNALKKFCSKHSINYEIAIKQPCTLDYIEEQAYKQDISFTSLEINDYYYNFVDSMLNQMYDKFIEELQSTY